MRRGEGGGREGAVDSGTTLFGVFGVVSIMGEVKAPGFTSCGVRF